MEITRSVESDAHQVDLVLDVLQVLVSEGLVAKDELGARFFLDSFDKTLEIVIEQVSTEDVLVDLLAELDHLLKLL